MEDWACWQNTTTNPPHKHCKQCILNTIGYHGSLDKHQLDSGSSRRIRNNSLIGWENNLITRTWMIGTMSQRRTSHSAEEQGYCVGTTTAHSHKHYKRFILHRIGWCGDLG